MKSKILTKLSTLPYFTVKAIEQLNECSPQTARQLVSRWEQKKRIIRLKQGYYMTHEFYLTHKDQIGFIGMVNAIIQPFSYLSLEYVLQTYDVLTEAVFAMTAVTTKNSQTIDNAFGSFSYRHLKPDLFIGFNELNYLDISYRVATKSKALFDYFYFRPTPALITHKKLNLAEELRLKIENWTIAEKEEFTLYIHQAKSPKMTSIYKNLQRHAWT